MAEIRNTICKGKIYKGEKRIFLCQDEMMGMPCSNYHGYAYSWTINQGSLEDMETCEVTNLKIISQSKSKPMKKKPAKENVKAIFKTANNGRWVVTENKGKNSKNKRFSVSLQSPNGNELAPDKGFNTMVAVMKHIHAVATTCQLIPLKAAKGGSVKSLSMNAYLTIKTV